MQTEGEGNCNLSPHVLFTLHFNGAVHHIHDIFRNGHTKAGPLNTADRRIPLSLKRLKDMLHKFPAHTDPGILDIKFIVRAACRRPRLLRDPQADDPSRARIFYRIAEQIQKYLIQAQLITIDLFVEDIHRVNIQL